MDELGKGGKVRGIYFTWRWIFGFGWGWLGGGGDVGDGRDRVWGR